MKNLFVPQAPFPSTTVPAVLLITSLLAGALPALAQTSQPIPSRPVPEHSPSPIDPGAVNDYPVLDNVEDDWVNLHPVQVRPMLITDDGANVYAVNSYHSTVRHFDASLQPVATFRTLWGPVSIAQHLTPFDDPQSDRLLVVCQHSDALAVHDRLSGDLIDVVELPPRPSDIVVLQDEHRAFVSTTGRHVVVEIDLLTLQIVDEYDVDSRRPSFLSVTAEGEVLVAARWSGNNSAVHRFDPAIVSEFDTQANTLSVLDLADPTIAVAPGLPDLDVFYLDPSVLADPATGRKSAVPVLRAAGTLLFGQGVNPATGEFWQLNTEANNKDPNKQDEPSIKGFISQNRLTRATLASPLGSSVVDAALAGTFTDLDLVNPSGTYDPARSVGTPYGLHFTATGHALVAGLMTDNVLILDPAGAWVGEFDVPEGCVPRQVLTDPTDQYVLVYCSGTNTVPVYFLSGLPPAVVGNLDLGFDPSPEAVREGRKIFFDASNSLNNNHSCATCHDEGEMDMLAWNLSNGQIDDKGPMVTQTLKSINRAVPFHWRGEQLQNLLDFNPAFEALLGGTPLSDVEFGQFEAFVLSLENRANPHQNATRVLDDTIEPPIFDEDQQLPDSSAIAGAKVFVETCEGCHHLPTGTSNDMIGDGAVFAERVPKRQWIQVAHLLSVHAKGLQRDVDVQLQPPAGGLLQPYPLLGAGLAHSGNPRNVFHFVSFFNLTAQEIADGTNFLFQFDTGLAPAVHRHQWLDAGNASAAQTALNAYLVPQANQRYCDLGVFGRTSAGGPSRVAAWVYDRASGLFVGDDNVSQPLTFFVNRALTNNEWFVFVGLPVGMGKTWAIDFDQDDYPNALEQLTPVDGRYVVDTDGDGDWDGHEWLNGGDPANSAVVSNDVTVPGIVGGTPAPQWSTSKVARLTFETDELTTAALNLNPPLGTGLPTLTYTSDRPTRQHNLLIDALYPGQGYTGRLTITDQAGLNAVQGQSVTARPFTDGDETVVVGEFAWTMPDQPAGTVNFSARMRVDLKTSGPPLQPAPNRVVVARALVNGVPATSQLVSTPNAFCVNQAPYTQPFHNKPVIPGPFIVSPATDAAGLTTLVFSLTGLNVGDEVILSVEAISSLDPDLPVCPLTGDPNLKPILANGAIRFFPLNWSFPDTPAARRKLEYVQP